MTATLSPETITERQPDVFDGLDVALAEDALRAASQTITPQAVVAEIARHEQATALPSVASRLSTVVGLLTALAVDHDGEDRAELIAAREHVLRVIRTAGSAVRT